MSDKSAIEWTNSTWNPVSGCTKVSPGCDHCYAETMHERFHGKGSFATVTTHPDRLDLPLRWRKPRRIFVNSMSDLFHKDVPDQYIAHVFAVMALAQRHTFQVLTKRHARTRSLLSRPDWRDMVLDRAVEHLELNADAIDYLERLLWPLPNVWLGVSVENQQWADTRIPALLDTPAAVRWISAEPLLGPIDIAEATRDRRFSCHACEFGMEGDCNAHRVERLDWVVVGGESGPGARPMAPNWARSIRQQCDRAGVPFLFKQWGAHDATGKRVGKKAAGRGLDGRTHDGYPAAS
jgi:protein gp37